MKNKVLSIVAGFLLASSLAFAGAAWRGTAISVGDRVYDALGIHLTGSTSLPLDATEDHLKVNTVLDSKTVRVNSRDYSQATGDSIGFQSKPAQAVASTGSVYGTQISPRCKSGIACANLIGIESSPILQGTSGDVSGDWRAFDGILEDGGAGRTITGDAQFIRARLNAGSTVTGDVMLFELLAKEGATDWELLGSVPAVTGVFVAPGNTSAISNAGYVKVKIGGTAYRIPVLEDE